MKLSTKSEDPRLSARSHVSFEMLAGALNAAIAVGLAFHLLRDLSSPRELAATDFTVFQTGWSLILTGHAKLLYDSASQGQVQAMLLGRVGSPGFQGGMMAFLHPPHAALVGCALGWIADRFGEPTAFRIWTIFSLGFLAKMVRLIRDELGGNLRLTAAVAITLAAFYPVLETLQEGQVSALLGMAALAFVVAIQRRQVLAAAAWLLVLSIKPQILPPLLIVLAVRGERGVLSAATLLGSIAVVVTGFVLGWNVWWDYLRQVRGLEQFFGVGTPDHMPTIRGLLSRTLVADGLGHRIIDGLTFAAWIAAIISAGIVAARSKLADCRGALAFGLAIGCIASPHLFPQDLLLWAAPVTLLLSLSHGRVWKIRSRVVLAWPLWFVLARALDIRGTPRPRMPIDLTLIPLILATAWAVREVVLGDRSNTPLPPEGESTA